ncbi:SKI family transcriptional corepressor 2 isoform X2 [Protopterus annectens]|uniref:SKI family transcriptional corepressor 2 isoform X2 n=1 Tax=Protopterus annectens TaxID=7888 RepID=UPI001CFC363A|nr:SKI family transcriptional corepressor 2 isoform X2 [Protopterus annectens]
MDISPLPGPNDIVITPATTTIQQDSLNQQRTNSMKPNQVGQVILYGVPIVSLVIDGQERLCLAQISNTLLKSYSYNEIHNRRVALGITCVQCTPVQLEILRRAGAMPISSRRCGMITKREAERLCKSFLGENKPPKLPDNFAFDVSHECAWGCRGSFIPARYNSSRAKCIKCSYCNMYFSPNKFIFHSHRTPEAKYTQPDAANFNSWRRHLKLTDKNPQDELMFAWEDVKAMFNGGSRKRALPQGHCSALDSVKAVNSVIPHMLTPELTQKRPRFEEDEDLDSTRLSTNKTVRNYPVIPVPSKGFGMLQKFPTSSLFTNPYTFPAFGLCHKKDDNDTINGQKSSGLSGLFWPGRKDAFYPPFCMFWPPRTPGGLPVPTYLQPQASALTSITENPALRQAFLDLSDQSEGSSIATSRDSLFEAECSSPPVSSDLRSSSDGRINILDVPTFQSRKQNYHSAFRPVVKDSESIAKLHGTVEDLGSERHLSPGTSCSYQSDSVESDEEQEVDVESNKQQDDEDEDDPFGTQYLQTRVLQEDSEEGMKDRPPFSNQGTGSHGEKSESTENIPSPPKESHSNTSFEETFFKANQKGRGSISVSSAKEDSLQEATKEANVSITDPESAASDFWQEIGEPVLQMNSPLSLKKDVEHMGKEELQKVLLEQIDLRRRLEQEFQALKGNTSFPVFNNFQDQMKRELAYRDEMVQQLQIIPFAASLMRKEKLSTHLSKS